MLSTTQRKNNKLLTMVSVIILLLCFERLYSQDSTKHQNLDSTFAENTKELVSKNSEIKDIKQQLQDANGKVADINTIIHQLEEKQRKTKADYKKLQEQYNRLNTALNEKLAKSRRLDSLVALQNANLSKLDTVINLKTTEINVKTKKVDSIQRAGDSIRRKGDSVQKAQAKTIEERQAEISKQLDQLEVIATIAMKDSVPVHISRRHGSDSSGTEKFKITQIDMTVKEGIILEVIVETSDGTFRNKKNIIDLVHLGDNYVDRDRGRLFKENGQYDPWASRTYMFLDDAIEYKVIRSYLDVAYGDFDIQLRPTPEDRVYLLRESTSINTYFNIAAFTDIKGLSGEANGLAQFTADAKFITHTKNLKNTANVLFNYLAFTGGLSKFDNDFKGSQLYHEDSVSRKDLLQRSSYGVGVKLNLLKGYSSPRPKHLFSDIQFNIGYSFLGSKVYDTILKAPTIIDTSFKTITQNQIYFEPLVTIDRHRNFSITLSSPLSLVSVKKSALIANDGWENWIRPSINLMYFGKKEPGSKIFFRYNHYINLKHPTNAFSQMQLGFSVNLTDIWSKADNSSGNNNPKPAQKPGSDENPGK